MASVDSIKITGGKELEKKLLGLPKQMRGKVLNSANRAAAKVLFDETLALVPVDTGNLKSGIRLRKIKTKNQYQTRYKVEVRDKGKVTILRKSTAKASLKSGALSSLKRKSSNSLYYAQFVEGTRKVLGSKYTPQPFMRPAFDSKKVAAVDKGVEKLRKGLASAKKRLKLK